MLSLGAEANSEAYP
jgi:ankyrin repeat protein